MQQISTERVKDKTCQAGQGDQLVFVQEIEIGPYKKMVFAQPSICTGK